MTKDKFKILNSELNRNSKLEIRNSKPEVY